MEAKFEFERKFREQILQCSRCGFCQAVCPIYGATLRPALNARGKMLLLKEVMDRKIELGDDLVETLFQCTTCASCAENCPSGVNVPQIIKQARKDMVSIGSCHPAFKSMNEVLQRYNNIYGEEELEDFGREKKDRAEVVYFVGCVGLYREDEATEATLDLLDHLAIDYTLVEEACCSGVLEDVGFSINERLARMNTDAILSTGARLLVTECPYCWRTFTSRPQYSELKNSIEILHITQFLKDFDFGVKTDKVVTYHDPCDLGRHCGIYEEPREIIRKIAPNFVEMAHSKGDSLCCGAGGGVRGAFAKNSLTMARRRLEEALEAGAEVLLTECNSCVHNLQQARLRKDNIRVYNTTGFISELLSER